jgi:MHS family proline/betaine transporter-like MFS transporter
MGIFSSLNRSQKEAIGLLQIGTFLEYFDLMLYVHMAVLLNELFFPKTDPHTAALLTALAFCSTYVLRPIGALVFGYIGDNIGRKTTVIITTMMMSISCVIMANLPTYAEIGIGAAWVVTICRMIQGMSSMGEIIGAQIYVTELTTPPTQYPTVALIGIASALGAVVSLGVATLVTSMGFNWRVAFWIGAGIAVIGSVARTRLRETPEFVEAKRFIRSIKDNTSHDGIKKTEEFLKSANNKFRGQVNKKTAISSFLINLVWPLFFFFVYVYCPNILKNKFGFTSAQIIHNNFHVCIFQLLGFCMWMFFSYKINPLRILKWKVFFLFTLILLIPSFLIHNNSAFNLFLLQVILIFLSPGALPAEPILIKNFPLFKRFTYATFIYAVSRALMYIVTSFSLIYLTEAFGPNGLLIIFIPTCIGYLYGILHFEKLENQKKHQIHTPFSTKPDELKLAG